MSAKVVMVQGTASSAGKSAVVTGLCRLYSRRGLRVAPFKAQNMALNSFVTESGGEMGRAQASQAEACGIAPSAAMNPILLKPASDRKSMVVVNGLPTRTMDAREYYAFRHTLRPQVIEAYASLANTHDLIVIEGAGSPAEINLRENDLVNMGMAAMAKAPVILVGDIDRGGVFASLYGTAALLEPSERAHIKGFIINKFRGDESILEPGLRHLERLLNIPVLGVLPYWDIHIDEEDSLSTRKSSKGEGRIEIAVLMHKRLSNIADLTAFELLPDVRMRSLRPGEALGKPDMVILPGCGDPAEAMRELRETGAAASVRALHAQGVVVAGLGGGFHLLGKTIADNEESGSTSLEGLGLLDMHAADTIGRFASQRKTGYFLAVPGALEGAAGLAVEGYAVAAREVILGAEALPLLHMENDKNERCCAAVSRNGLVFGADMHGMFDSVASARAVVNFLRRRRSLEPLSEAIDVPATCREYRIAEYDKLADVLESRLDMRALDVIVQEGMPR